MKFTKSIFVLFLGILLVYSCKSTPKKVDKEYIIVVAEGQDRDDAILESKKKMLDQGKGFVLVQGESAMIDGESLYKEVREHTDGYVYDYQILKEWPNGGTGGMHKLKAKGKLNKSFIEDVVKDTLKTVGSPRFMVLIKEDFFGRDRDAGDSLTEKQIAEQFERFHFLDRKMLQKRLAKESGDIIGAYDDPSAAERALRVAAELSADFLLVGKTKLVKGGEVMGSGMYSIHSTVEYKVIGVATAQIVAASVTSGTYPHINREVGAQKSIGKAILRSQKKTIPQIVKKWSQGRTIRLVIEGIDYDTYLDQDIPAILSRIRGVSNLTERKTGDDGGNIVIELKALMDGTRLYRRMRQKKSKLGINFTKKELRGGIVHIVVR
ncbi:MAG: hypothetical protein AAF518_05960 [Spirochaetota bacterium]